MELARKGDIGRKATLPREEGAVLVAPQRSAEDHALISTAAARTAVTMFW
jgi:hypothetical protein